MEKDENRLKDCTMQSTLFSITAVQSKVIKITVKSSVQTCHAHKHSNSSRKPDANHIYGVDLVSKYFFHSFRGKEIIVCPLARSLARKTRGGSRITNIFSARFPYDFLTAVKAAFKALGKLCPPFLFLIFFFGSVRPLS